MPTWLAGTIAAGVVVVTALAALGGWAAGARWASSLAALRARAAAPMFAVSDGGAPYTPLRGDGNPFTGAQTRNAAFDYRVN